MVIESVFSSHTFCSPLRSLISHHQCALEESGGLRIKEVKDIRFFSPRVKWRRALLSYSPLKNSDNRDAIESYTIIFVTLLM